MLQGKEKTHDSNTSIVGKTSVWLEEISVNPLKSGDTVTAVDPRSPRCVRPLRSLALLCVCGGILQGCRPLPSPFVWWHWTHAATHTHFLFRDSIRRFSFTCIHTFTPHTQKGCKGKMRSRASFVRLLYPLNLHNCSMFCTGRDERATCAVPFEWKSVRGDFAKLLWR